MCQLVTGIGEFKISVNAQDTIKSYALGSCIALIAFDAANRIAGMIHVALPDSSVDPEKAKMTPGHFVDTGLPAFLESFWKAGAVRKNTWIKLAGGSNVIDPNFLFDIGKRNLLAIRKFLWTVNMGTMIEDVGGNFSRSVTVSVASGEVTVTSGTNKWNL